MEELLKQIELLKKEIASMKQSKSLPVGIVEAFAMRVPPMGWVVCNGQELRIDDYQELYNAIGNVFNEDNTPEGFFASQTCKVDLFADGMKMAILTRNGYLELSKMIRFKDTDILLTRKNIHFKIW